MTGGVPLVPVRLRYPKAGAAMTLFSDPWPSNEIVSAGLLAVVPLAVVCPCWTGDDELLAD